MPLPVAEPFASPSTNSSLTVAPASQTVSDPSMETYLIRHNRAASSVGRQGMAGIVVPLIATTPDNEDEVQAVNETGETAESQR